MKISLNHLRNYVDINVSPEELCDRMVMAGFEVEDIVKQHAYQATFGDICELNSFKMANAFLFPHEGSTVIYSGSVSYGPLLDFGLNKFEPIDIYLLPAKVIYRNYIAGKQVDLDALPVQTVTYQIVSA